jgi:CDP-4-dehydro-6-deoxyglucose reductase
MGNDRDRESSQDGHYRACVLPLPRGTCYTAGPMSTLKFKDLNLPLKPYESVLDCLLRHGVAVPYACKAGMCQACLVRAVDCTASEESRKWIKPELQERGFTLACQWVPDTDVGAALPTVEDFAHKTRLLRLSPLNETTLKVELELCDPGARFTCRPGQYLTLTNPDGVSRSYSVANDHAVDGTLELHVSRTSHGLFSGWVFNAARPGDQLYLRGPAGSCHYGAVDDAQQPLLLAGNGSGLAPLYGILRDALRAGHQGPITLVHGGRSAAQLYLVDQLAELASTHGNFTYLPCVREQPAQGAIRQLDIAQAVQQAVKAQGTAQRQRAFVCGSPALVHDLRKQLYLLGLRATNILCDPFTERPVAANTDDPGDAQ